MLIALAVVVNSIVFALLLRLSHLQGVTMGAVSMAAEGPAAAEPKPSRRKTTHVLVPLKPIEAGYDAGDEGGEDEGGSGPTAVAAAAATRSSEEGCQPRERSCMVKVTGQRGWVCTCWGYRLMTHHTEDAARKKG